MTAVFLEQVLALIEGGVDILLVETCQDLLQAKAALAAVFDGMKQAGKRLPVQVQVTLEATGTMLLGTEIGAALTSLEPFDVDAIGLNCATGPKEMNDAVRYLGINSPKEISVLPNAGLPQNVGGHAVYALKPEELAEYHKLFITEYGVRIVGGCCGTTRDHIQKVVEVCANLEPAKREVKPTAAAASAYSMVPLDLEPKPLIVAEEMNATTRVAAFRNLLQQGKYDDILAVAKKLAAEGSHMLDLCCAIVGEDEKKYISSVLEKVATRVPAPILVDSTEADVVEEALKRIPGKAIINSINLEDGEKRTSKVLPMAKRYGAAVIALTIDEDGMALTADKKVAIAKRIFQLATENYGIRPADIIFDALTLPISTGQEEYRSAGMETLNAVKRIKQELPEVKTILGVSNISFGLATYPRRVLNSVFMHEAVNYGLDMAIVNYSKIYPLYKIPEAEVEMARKLIYQDRSQGDPLQAYMAFFAGREKTVEEVVHVESLSVEDKLKYCIVHGEKSIGEGENKQSLEQVLEDALQSYSPLDLINNVLLDGMKTVGELFGARKMQLPSVLDSASVMKAAVAYLEPRMEKVAGREKGIMVLATVKGDVHDIGKNLVDIILSNNGYKVVNLGIKQPADTIIKAAQEHGADAIGLSGLLVKSTLEMKYVIQDLQQQGLKFPVVCGGAALTRKYVEDDLRREYKEAVFYAGDAFDGLHVMDDLTQSDEKREALLAEGRVAREYAKAAVATAQAEVSTERSTAVSPAPNIPHPPFWGARVKKDFDLREVFQYINETALFKNQWQLKTASQEDYLRVVEEKYRPILNGLEEEIIREGWFEPQSRVGILALPERRQHDRRSGLRAPASGQRTPRPERHSRRTRPLHLPAPEGRPSSLHLGFLCRQIQRADGRDRPLAGHHRASGERVDPEVVPRRRVHALSLPARDQRRDRRGAGRAAAPHHAPGAGHLWRGRAAHQRPFPPEISRLALLLRLPGLPAHGGSNQAVPAPSSRRDHRGEADHRVHARSGAIHLGDRGAPSGSEVFCGLNNSGKTRVVELHSRSLANC